MIAQPQGHQFFDSFVSEACSCYTRIYHCCFECKTRGGAAAGSRLSNLRPTLSGTETLRSLGAPATAASTTLDNRAAEGLQNSSSTTPSLTALRASTVVQSPRATSRSRVCRAPRRVLSLPPRATPSETPVCAYK